MNLPDISDLVIPSYKKRNKVSDEMVEVFVELTKRGYNPKQISDITTVSEAAIKERLRFYGDEEGWAEQRKLKDVSPLANKIRGFCGIEDDYGFGPGVDRYVFTEEELLEVREPCCYITGVPINIDNPDSYSLDHRLAKANGGFSTLENCYFIDSHANIAKWDRSEEDLLDLCFKVVKHHITLKAKSLIFNLVGFFA